MARPVAKSAAQPPPPGTTEAEREDSQPPPPSLGAPQAAETKQQPPADSGPTPTPGPPEQLLEPTGIEAQDPHTVEPPQEAEQKTDTAQSQQDAEHTAADPEQTPAQAQQDAKHTEANPEQPLSAGIKEAKQKQETHMAKEQQQDYQDTFTRPPLPPLPPPLQRPPPFSSKREPPSPVQETSTPPKCQDNKHADPFSTPQKRVKAETRRSPHQLNSGRRVKTEGNMKRSLSVSEVVKVLMGLHGSTKWGTWAKGP